MHGIPESYRPIPSSKTLTFKMRPSAQPLLWKRVLFAREYHFDIKGLALNLVLIQRLGRNPEMAYCLTGAGFRNLLNLVLVHFPASTLPARAFICRWFNEPLSGYLRTSFSSCVSIISWVFQEIVAYQELFCVVTLLSELERPRQRRRKRGHIKSNRFPIKVDSQGLPFVSIGVKSSTYLKNEDVFAQNVFLVHQQTILEVNEIFVPFHCLSSYRNDLCWNRFPVPKRRLTQKGQF